MAKFDRETPHEDDNRPAAARAAGDASGVEPEPGYDEWVRSKIEAALKHADEHPETRIPIDQVWKKFGLDD